jgi:flagellar biogenesis protein FliO
MSDEKMSDPKENPATAVLTLLFKALAKFLLTLAFVTLMVWAVVPLATGQAFIPTPAQALGITSLLYLFHSTTPRYK